MEENESMVSTVTVYMGAYDCPVFCLLHATSLCMLVTDQAEKG